MRKTTIPSSPYQDAIRLLRETQANIEKLSAADGWEVMMLRNHLKTLAKKLAEETDKLDVTKRSKSKNGHGCYVGTCE